MNVDQVSEMARNLQAALVELPYANDSGPIDECIDDARYYADQALAQLELIEEIENESKED